MKTVLVVDDNADNRYIIGRLLELRGWKVLQAVDGRAALVMLQETIPDLIFMDLSMPDLDGWMTTELVKSQPGIAHVPVIAVTAHVTPENLKRAQDVGCVDHITKPFDADTLWQKVALYLDN